VIKTESTKEKALEYINCIVYGGSGTGKTSSAKTLPTEKTLILSTEKGLLPLAGHDFQFVPIKSWNDLLNTYKELLEAENQDKYRVLFIDSLNELNDLCKEHIIKVERPQKKIEIGKVYDDLLTQQDYSLLDTKMRRMIRLFRDLPYHQIFTCGEDDKKDEETGYIKSLPALNGKLQYQLGGYFDEIFRLITKEEEKGKPHARYLLTSKTEKTITKDRSGALEFYEPADWSLIFGKIKEHYAKIGKEIAA